MQIKHNTIRHSNYFGIILWPGINNAAISRNKFIDIGNNWAGILVRGYENSIYNNDYRESNLPGWTTHTPSGPGAIVLAGPTMGNFIHEMKLPTHSSLCEMILDLSDDPSTNDYDG